MRPLLCVAVFVFAQGRCLGGDGGKKEDFYGDAYVTGSIADAVSLMPMLSTDSASHAVTGIVFNGLTKVDKDLNIVGDVAQEWTISEDGRIITFLLKKGVRWHDGKPLTARDVKFTFDTIRDPDTGCPYIASYSDIEKVEAIGDHTVRFVYSAPYAPALSKLGTEIMPFHLLENADMRSTPFKRSPAGSGPYIFKRWKTDQYIILESNHDYFEHRPFIDKYVIRVIPDQAVQYLELITGGIDTMGLTSYQYLYRAETEVFKARHNRYRYLARSYSYIGYNLKEGLFKDRRVRRALSYAINKKEIIEGVLLGLGEPCSGPFFVETPYYNEAAESYGYDLAKARALLREAGWIDSDGDGILDKDGEPFKFRIITNQGNKEREDIATIAQRQWRELGIAAEVQVIAWAPFLTEFVDKKRFQAVILGWTLPLDPDCYNVWHSEASGEGGLNFISYKNEEVDRLIEVGRRTFDNSERIRIYKGIHSIIAEDAPYTFLYFPYAKVALSKRFEGVEPAPAGIGYNFIDWYVTPGNQRY